MTDPLTDSYVYVLTALLPLTALMLVTQANPYHALVLRGILGAVAALAYIVLGAADVALTEALVGTMLAITLYAVAVRSSLVMRLGVLKEGVPDQAILAHRAVSTSDDALVALRQTDHVNPKQSSFALLLDDLRTVCSKHYLRLELVPYSDSQALQQALVDKEIHAILQAEHRSRYIPEDDSESSLEQIIPHDQLCCSLRIRIRRLYDILQAELASRASLIYVDLATSSEVGPVLAPVGEQQP